ncbi:unnamed protein product [Penicillium nalgiovense]|nr:unnamed protein product [Penicillium nalgiovense]
MLLEAYELATAQPIEEDFQRSGYLPSTGDISPIQSSPPRKTPLPSIPSPDDRAINGVRVGTEQIVLRSTPDITVPPSLTFSDDPETWALNDLDIRSVNHSRPCSPEGEVLQATNVPVPLDLEYPLHSSYDCSLPTVPVTACLSLQGLPSHIEEHCWADLEPSNQSDAIVQVLKEPCISQVSRKRHSSTQLSNRPEKRAATSPKIKYGGFLERESQKCEAKGHPLPCETYFQRHIEQRLLTTLRSSDPLGTILIRIADAGAFICLKNALLSSNLSSGEIVSRQTSKKDRYEIINRLDGKFALNVLLKRYHLMELFRDCGGLQSRTSTNSVFYTVESFPPKAQKKGNPNHNDDAMITERMMREVFPQLSTDNPEYERRRRAMTRLRIIGRRYQTLVNNFGQSIICLLQPCSLTGELDKGVSDNMIYDLKEADFKLLVELLEASQGKPLRDLCTKANPVVEELIYGHQTRAHRLRLQEVEIEDIVTIPKGSPDLELLLSSEDSMQEHSVIG